MEALRDYGLAANEIIVDLFAGGGGASLGIEMATGRPVDVAINHDPAAILMHRKNHSQTIHLAESVWDAHPARVAAGRKVGLLWLSPDCKHFSKANGGKPLNKNIRSLAWAGIRWAALVHPRIIILENVEEFKTWCRLGPDGKADMRYKGETFRSFVWQLEQLGYTVDWRELAACDYGAPTTRKRFVLIARNDGRPIVWPEATHGDPDSEAVRTGRLSPWKTAAEVVDFSLPCPSIFATKEEVARAYGGKAAVRPLADNTMCRIARGVDKFTIKSESPYFMAGDDIEAAALTAIGQTGFSKDRSYGADKPVRTIVSKAEQCLVKTKLSPCIIQYHSERSEYVRAQSLDKPLFVVDAAPRYAMAVAQMVKYYGQGIGQRVNDPMHTITVKDREALILSHIVKFKGQNLGQSANGPLQTITANAGEFGEVKTYLVKVESMAGLGRWPEVRALLNRYCGYSLADDELLLFNIDGAFYFIVDIGLRMLTPRELFNAQGFLSDYEIDFSDEKGRPYSKSEQVARCGNAVCPPLAEALVRANLPDKAIPRFRSMRELRAFLAA